MKLKIIFIIFIFLPLCSIAQESFRGMVMIQENGKISGLEGATVYWLDTDVGTTTNENGWYTIGYKPEYKKLVISFVGYQTDTIEVNSNKELHHLLKEGNELEAVEIETKRKSTSTSYLLTENTSRISSEELLKAACCNLSESFETNPSIDVNFSDAVTGTKQIQMLGLNSPYILIAQENIPTVRGASQAYGLTFTPGTWVESIQITKGAGSVVNGYESIAGQINAELVKPLTDNKFFLNAYGSNNGRVELNTHFNQKLSDKWSTGIYLHGNNRSKKIDSNDDNFLDVPLAKQINVMNRWQYQNAEKGWVSFLNLRYLSDEKQAGEINFDPDSDKFSTTIWGSEINTSRFDASLKLGYVFPEIPYQSFGFQTAFSNHKQESYYGLRTYDIEHQSVYSSLLFNSIIGDTRNKFKTGINFTYDKYKEFVSITDHSRVENSIGGFFEYTFDDLENFSLIAGIRADQHNKLDFFVTPRLHLRYAPWEKGVLRASIGRGKRSANIFAENQQLFASNRSVNIVENGGDIYGLEPEVAWNYGFSFLQGFNLFDQKGEVIFDYYKTDFTNQVVVDWENSEQISFYNIEGKSFANSFQTELSYNPFGNFDIKLSYKYYDVQTEYLSGKNEKPLIPKHRFFANLSYNTQKESESFWKFDATYNLVGRQRFPSTNESPSEFQRSAYSEKTNLLNLQVTKVFSRNFEMYLGGENITNTTQNNPIVSSENPFGSYFDSTMIYAPINGANYYLGLRYNLK
ncbi:TonB-dependent receptor [Urechidicola croceus]|uniref:TonB-dependent receptor n=1 Tax=Urechidicola croceus TaxID=1850246 RepID=A0A1D8PAQ2_9FLAO|nr:TonB-dependent receptor [Urechidicola croceus]AOW21664.1 TonB-dependent receptor [Urechidicola croceus]